jgi:hypothetical protein
VGRDVPEQWAKVTAGHSSCRDGEWGADHPTSLGPMAEVLEKWSELRQDGVLDTASEWSGQSGQRQEGGVSFLISTGHKAREWLQGSSHPLPITYYGSQLPGCLQMAPALCFCSRRRGFERADSEYTDKLQHYTSGHSTYTPQPGWHPWALYYQLPRDLSSVFELFLPHCSQTECQAGPQISQAPFHPSAFAPVPHSTPSPLLFLHSCHSSLRPPHPQTSQRSPPGPHHPMSRPPSELVWPPLPSCIVVVGSWSPAMIAGPLETCSCLPGTSGAPSTEQAHVCRMNE